MRSIARRCGIVVTCVGFASACRPLLALALIAIVGANYMPTVGPLRLPGELGSLVIKGTKVTMQQPRLSGYTADSRPYEFTANSADQELTKPI